MISPPSRRKPLVWISSKPLGKRHSYRGPYLNEPVAREHLLQIVQAGLQAPSARNAQTTEFIIVDDAALMRQIAALHPTNQAMQQAKAYIVCLLDRAPEAVYEGHSFQIEDCAAAVENMLLAATALGYASVWVDGWLRIKGNGAAIASLLAVPETKYPRVLLPLGRPAEPRIQNTRKPLGERAWFNRYKDAGNQR